MKTTDYDTGIDAKVILTLPHIQISHHNYPLLAVVVDWNGTVTDQSGDLRKDVKPFLKRRKKEGKLIAIASDMHPLLIQEELEKCGFKPSFFDAYFWCEPEKRKDVRKISQEIKVDPRHLIVFGDNHYIDLSSARRARSAAVRMDGIYGAGIKHFKDLEWIFNYSK